MHAWTAHLNGVVPNMSSYSKMPKLHQSTGAEWPAALMTCTAHTQHNHKPWEGTHLAMQGMRMELSSLLTLKSAHAPR
jgi:hypothetical protein